MTAAGGPQPRRSLNTFVDDLKKNGYTVKYDASLPGKSGVVHRFDLLAERAEGGKRTVVCMRERGKNPVEEMIGLFIMAFDVDAKPCYITGGSVETKIAEAYGITFLAEK